MQKVAPKCKSHPAQPITNYCIQQGCYTQLCIACICEHTEAHNRYNTKPKYQLLKHTLTNTCDNMSRLQQQINDQKNRITAIIDKINVMQNQAYSVLKHAREETIGMVNRVFDQLENNYQNHLEQEKSKTGLLNQGRLNQMYSDLHQHNLQLYNTYKDLTSNNNTRLIRTIHTQLLPNTANFIQTVNKELISNENFLPGLIYRPIHLQQVAAAIKKLISTSVSYTLPQKTQTNQFLRTKSISKTVRQSHINLKPMNSTIGRQLSAQKSASFLKNGLASPRNMVMTAKQNYYLKRDDQNKNFTQTYSG